MERRRLLDLPSEYTRLNYIESTGTQYIDTGYVPNANTVWTFDLMIRSYGTAHAIRQGRHGSGQRLSIYNSYIYNGNKVAELAIGGYEQRSPSLTESKRYSVTLDIPNHTGIISDYGTWNFTPITWSNSQTLLLFKRNVGTYIDGDGGFVQYSHIVSENGVEVQHFVPAHRNADGVVGMYDLCGTICPLTGTPFYTNAGTGTFLGG